MSEIISDFVLHLPTICSRWARVARQNNILIDFTLTLVQDVLQLVISILSMKDLKYASIPRFPTCLFCIHNIINYARNIQEIYRLLKIDLNTGGQSWKFWRRWPRNTASYANSAQWFGYFLESFHKIVVVLSHKTLYIIPLRHKTSLGLAPWLLYFSRKMSFVFYSRHEL